jgi:hypothetical protein
MLMTDPTTVVLEEQPFIVEIEQELGGLAGMAQADAAVLAAARARYFERVAAHTRLTPGMVIVDKQPLHTNQAAAIHRLFPEARFVLAMRHPCDVLLSCFLTNFRTNNAMSSFLDLRDAASLYDLTFSHWEETLALFDLPVRTVVYERLVEDTARELRPLFDWLGLAWPEEGLDHREAARARAWCRPPVMRKWSNRCTSAQRVAGSVTSGIWLRSSIRSGRGSTGSAIRWTTGAFPNGRPRRRRHPHDACCAGPGLLAQADALVRQGDLPGGAGVLEQALSGGGGTSALAATGRSAPGHASAAPCAGRRPAGAGARALDFLALVLRASLLEQMGDDHCGQAWDEALAQRPSGDLGATLTPVVTAGKRSATHG